MQTRRILRMPAFRASGYRLAPYLPSLVEIQRHDFVDFLTNGITQRLSTINPIQVRQQKIQLVFYPQFFQLTKPTITPREAILRQKTYDSLLYVPGHLFFGDQPLEKPTWLLLGNLPMMTRSGHFVINGSGRVLVNQIVRRPGIYFKDTFQGTGHKQTRVLFSDVICRRGAWVRIQRDKKQRFWVCLKNTPKIQLDDFIAAFEAVEHRLRTGEQLSEYSRYCLRRIELRLDLSLGKHPGDSAYRFLYNRFKNPKVYNLGAIARHQLNKKLGLTEHVLQLTSHDFRRIKEYLLDMANYHKVPDDIDNLGNRRVRTAGELYAMQFETGLARIEKSVKQKVQRLKHLPSASVLIDVKPMNQAFREFFVSTNPLAQFLDQVNPLSEVNHKRRITATGPGGVSRENANLEMRSIHPTHYGRVCPIETPEGRNAGLVNSLTVYGRVNHDGYIETPYYRVFAGQIQKYDGVRFFSTPQEQAKTLPIAPPDLYRDSSHVLPASPIPARIVSELQEDFVRSERMDIDYIGLGPAQLMSIATSLIPFLEHDDANRALMGSNMQRQTVPLMQLERPIVSTGLEPLVVGESGHIVQAETSGIVSYVSGKTVRIEHSFQRPYPLTQGNINRLPVRLTSNCPGFIPNVPSSDITTSSLKPTIPKSQMWINQMQHMWPSCSTPTGDHLSFSSGLTTLSLQTYERSNQETALIQRPAVVEGEWVQQGDLIADCAASVSGQLALGHNLLVAYVPWEGYNFEDAVIISERLIFDDVYTTIHIEKYDAEVRETPDGFELITKFMLPTLSKRAKKTLDSNGLIKVGQWVEPGDILVGKMAPLKKDRLSPYQRMVYDILGKETPKTENVSLRVPHGVHGRIVNTQILRTSPLSPSILSELRRLLKRMPQVGEIPEVFPMKVRIYIAEKRRIQVGDKVAGRHGNKGIISCVLPRQDMPYLPDGHAVDMVLNPLGVPSRMNVGQVFECLLGLAGSYLGQEFRVTPFDEMFGAEASRSLVYLKLYQARLKTQQKWLFQPNFPGKTRVFDGRSGECFDQFVTVGCAYMLKLVHLVEEKIHARTTGPYAMITQQPLGGRAKQGGQRVGEMEVWAFEAFGAAYTLQELLTIKSDDIYGRATLLDSIVDTAFQKLAHAPKDLIALDEPEFQFFLGTTEAFRVLLRELQALCLDVGVYALTEPVPPDEEQIEEEPEEEETEKKPIERVVKRQQINLFQPPRDLLKKDES